MCFSRPPPTQVSPHLISSTAHGSVAAKLKRRTIPLVGHRRSSWRETLCADDALSPGLVQRRAVVFALSVTVPGGSEHIGREVTLPEKCPDRTPARERTSHCSPASARTAACAGTCWSGGHRKMVPCSLKFPGREATLRCAVAMTSPYFRFGKTSLRFLAQFHMDGACDTRLAGRHDVIQAVAAANALHHFLEGGAAV